MRKIPNLSADPIVTGPSKRTKPSKPRKASKVTTERQTALVAAPVAALPDLSPLVPSNERGVKNKKGSHTLAVVDAMERACELRRAGLPYVQIGELMGISTMYAHRLVNTAKRERVMVAADALIDHELSQLELLREKAIEIMNETAPLVNAGAVCRRRFKFDPPCRLNFDPGWVPTA